MDDRGKLYVFEGSDAVGKSILSERFASRLRAAAHPCHYMTFPGKEDGTLGKVVYAIHHNIDPYGIRSLSETGKQLLHIAAHVDAIENRILPRLKAGEDVVLDRFWWSTLVYGKVFGANHAALQRMVELELSVWQDFQPERIFLVRRQTPLRAQEDLGIWQSLCRGYKKLAARERLKYPVSEILNESSVEDAIRAIEKAIGIALPARQNQSAAETEVRQMIMPFSPGAATILSRIAPAKPTAVFDTYWRFAAKRQDIFFRRLEGMPPPWTDDGILLQHKFTNAYRASDRVSQYLIRKVIYQENQSPDEVFFRILLFKIFNKIETWEWLDERVGPITYRDYSFVNYDDALRQAQAAGRPIYSAAYIMPSAGSSFGFREKHRNHLRLIERMVNEHVPTRIAECASMQQAYEILRSYPSLGPFLAYQYVIDINYSKLTNFKETEFVVPGPGAKDGIRKCFSDLGGLNEPEIIRWMMDHQEEEFERLGLKFRDLWTRRLHLVDCQNLFCEVDKYARVFHPDISGITGRTRIKQAYRMNPNPLSYWYPPKWGINEFIRAKGASHDRGISRAGCR